VQITDGKRYLFVLAGDKVQRRAIETGYDEGSWLEVKSGVKEGEEIVLAGMDGLSDGATVRVTRNVDPYTGKVAGPPSSPAAPAPPSPSAPPSPAAPEMKRN
jgi:membrane fusion protein, multidrug efflux system